MFAAGSNTAADVAAEIVIPPNDVSVVSGEDEAATFECVANARPLSRLSVSWYRKSLQGTRVRVDGGGQKYSLSVNRRRLRVINPVVDDAGVYECEASFILSSGISTSVSASANLNILGTLLN